MLQESDTRKQWGKLHKTAKRKYAAKKRKAWFMSNAGTIENVILFVTVLAAAAACIVIGVTNKENGAAVACTFLEYVGLGAVILGAILSLGKLKALSRLKKILLHIGVFFLSALLFLLRGRLAAPDLARFLLPVAALLFFYINIFFGGLRRS